MLTRLGARKKFAIFWQKAWILSNGNELLHKKSDVKQISFSSIKKDKNETLNKMYRCIPALSKMYRCIPALSNFFYMKVLYDLVKYWNEEFKRKHVLKNSMEEIHQQTVHWVE